MTEQVPLNTSLPLKLRIEDYLLLDRAGAFDAYAKTELIDGEVYGKNAQHRPHARIKTRLYRLIADALDRLDGELEAIVESSVAIPPHNAPEPDIVLTSQPQGEGLIPLASVRLIVEIADTSLSTDLGEKALLYAAAAVPEYWVADVNSRVIHQLWAPAGEGYAERRDEIAFGERIAAATVAGLAVETGEIGG